MGVQLRRMRGTQPSGIDITLHKGGMQRAKSGKEVIDYTQVCKHAPEGEKREE